MVVKILAKFLLFYSNIIDFVYVSNYALQMLLIIYNLYSSSSQY